MRFTKTVSGAACLLAAVVGGCGGSGAKTSTARTAADSPAGFHPFADFRIAYSQNIDYLDPALSETNDGTDIMWNVYLPLLGYPHAGGSVAGAQIVPYLATALPQISDGGKVYTLFLRKGLKYSNGALVKASDFKYAIERNFLTQSSQVSNYTDIVGAPQFAKTLKGQISGITTNDATGEISIRLIAPLAYFENVLAMVSSAPVPASTPAKDQSTTPIPATGPYVIANYQPNRSVLLKRNPYWRANRATGITTVPIGNPDEITITDFSDSNVALTDTLNGEYDFDYNEPPSDRIGELTSKYAGQIKLWQQPNVYFFFMNTNEYPFTKVAVRQAVEYAINRQALLRASFGGIGQTTDAVVPNDYPLPAGANTMYPYDPAKARAMLKAAGAAGAHVTIWTDTSQPDGAPPAGIYLQQALKAVGLTLSLKIIAPSVFNTAASRKASHVQIGWSNDNIGFISPAAWYSQLLSGSAISPVNDANQANFDDPAINAQIASLSAQPYTPKQDAAWAQLEKEIETQAPWASFADQGQVSVFNSDINLGCYVDTVAYGFDFMSICKKG